MDDLKLVAVLGNGRRHALRLAPELEPRRALEYLAGAAGRVRTIPRSTASGSRPRTACGSAGARSSSWS